jgi:hypothetical protein
MFFRRQAEPEHTERPERPDSEEMPSRAEPFVPPPQAPDQTDDVYRQALIDLIAEIDRTKRDIKGQIHSSAITAKAERVSVDQVWLRRAKDKIDHLTREREEIRKALHTVNERIKEGRRMANVPRPRPPLTVPQAFVDVARERLPPDLYDGLMRDAVARMEAERGVPPPSAPGETLPTGSAERGVAD